MMAVIFYQLTIIVSLLVTHFIKRNLTIWLCLFWTAWTLVMVVYTPLAIIQLGVVWGTWFLLKKLSSQHNKINKLESYDPSLVRCAVPCYLTCKLAADYVTVVLTGEGADELFTGYH